MKINEHMKNTWKTITEQIKTNKTKYNNYQKQKHTQYTKNIKNKIN